MDHPTESLSPTSAPQGQLRNAIPASLEPPKPRKRSAADTGQQGQNQSFFFVNAGSSMKEKRAHVMRHHIQNKKKQNMSAAQANRQPRREYRNYPWIKRGSIATNASERQRNNSEVFAPVARTYFPNYPDTSYRGSVTRLPGPRTLLDGLRDDPFASLPIDRNVTWDESQLYDLWITRLSYWSGQNIRMKERAFQVAIRHRATFEAFILGYCARWKPHLDGKPNDTMIRYYESKVLNSLSNADGPGGPVYDDDSLSLIFTGLTLQEERFGDKKKAQQYAQEAKTIQFYRKSQPTNTTCRTLLFFILCVMKPPSSTISVDEKLQLVIFLRTGDHFMTKYATEEYRRDVPQREETFQFNSPIFQLLSSGPRPSQVPFESRSYVVNKNIPTMEWTRTAALIYITLALYDFRDSKDKTTRFLNHLHSLISKHELDRNPACESFIFFLVEESCDFDLRQSNRGWQTNELLNIHKKLPPDLQFRFNDMLMNYLMLCPPITSVDDFEGKLMQSLSS